MTTVLIFISIIAFTTIAWQRLPLAIVLLLVALPSYLIRFEIGPFPTTLLEIFLLIIFVRFFLSRPKILFKRSDWPIALLLIASIVSTFVAPDRLAAFGILKAYFIEPIILFFIVRTVVTTEQDRNKILSALGLGAIFVSAFAIFQKITGHGLPPPWDFERRVTGLFEYPNALGLYLAPIITIAFLKLFSKINKKNGILWLLAAAFGLTAIIFSKTEAALVAIPASIFISFSCLAFRTTQKRSKQFLLPFFGLLIFLIILLMPTVSEKLLLQDDSGLVRRSQWRETWEMLQDRPLFGAGLSGYPTALRPYHTDRQYEIFQYPHNIVLNIWSELGLLGLIAFLWLAFEIIIGLSRPQFSIINYRLLAFSALLTMTIHGLVDVPYFKNDLAVMTWLLLALLL